MLQREPRVVERNTDHKMLIGHFDRGCRALGRLSIELPRACLTPDLAPQVAFYLHPTGGRRQDDRVWERLEEPVANGRQCGGFAGTIAGTNKDLSFAGFHGFKYFLHLRPAVYF